MTEKWPWPCLVPLLPLSPRLVWVGSPGPSAVVSTQPNGHRWLGLFCLLQPSWHGSLGRLVAPWPVALMGYSSSAITSWCFVCVGVAQDEIWLSTLKYGSSCREIQQCVKHRQRAILWQNSVHFIPVSVGANVNSFMTTHKAMTCCWFPHHRPQWSRGGDREGRGEVVEEKLYSCTVPCSSQTVAC